jgi:hypothetical protein
MSTLDKLEQLSLDLAEHHRELAQLLMAEKEAKIEAFDYSDASTVRQRDHEADRLALPLTRDILKIKGEIAALTELRDYLRLVLQHGG